MLTSNYSSSEAVPADYQAWTGDHLPPLVIDEDLMSAGYPSGISALEAVVSEDGSTNMCSPGADGSDEGHVNYSRRGSRASANIDVLRARNERRLSQCRVNAKLARERKKQFLAILQSEVTDLRHTTTELRAMVSLLVSENDRLKMTHGACADCLARHVSG